jgi:hypothetical protein
VSSGHPPAIVKAGPVLPTIEGEMPEHRPYSPAAAELDALLCDPALRGRWPEGFTVDDVLAELMMLGRVAIDVRDESAYSGDALPFACRLELHERSAIFGEGRTLTAATLRCLIEAEADLAVQVARGLAALGDLLGDG